MKLGNVLMPANFLRFLLQVMQNMDLQELNHNLENAVGHLSDFGHKLIDGKCGYQIKHN